MSTCIVGSANPENVRKWVAWADTPIDHVLLAEVHENPPALSMTGSISKDAPRITTLMRGLTCESSPPRSAEEFPNDRHAFSVTPGPGEGPGPGPPGRDLWDRHQRVSRQDALFQLPEDSGPRVGCRGRRGGRGCLERQARRSLLGRAVHQRPEQLRRSRRGRPNCCEKLEVLGVHRDGGPAPAVQPAGSQTSPLEEAWRGSSLRWWRPWRSAVTPRTGPRLRPTSRS